MTAESHSDTAGSCCEVISAAFSVDWRGRQPAARLRSLPLVMLKLVRAFTAHAVDVIAEAVLHPRVAARGTIPQRTEFPSRLSPSSPTLQQVRHASMMPHKPLAARCAKDHPSVVLVGHLQRCQRHTTAGVSWAD